MAALGLGAAVGSDMTNGNKVRIAVINQLLGPQSA